MAGTGRIYRRGTIYYIAYRWDGREYRESARSSEVADAERLLATRLAERRARAGARTFDDLAAWYLEDYAVRGLRRLNTARGRVAHLRAVFTGWPATAITRDAVRRYQRTRRAAGAAAATVNRETSALSRMLQLAVRGGQLAQRPVFPERLVENGPWQGFFEHAEYQAVRRYLPPPYQDVLDFAYYSGGGSGRFSSCGGARSTRRARWCASHPNARRPGSGACCRSRRRFAQCWHGAGPTGGGWIPWSFAAMR